MNLKTPRIGAMLSLLFWLPLAAGASVNLKGVQITEGSQVELIFDGKVDVAQVKTEFVREHIQISLMKTSVYPAKVNLVQGRELSKVFAYQYAPELVRCRLTMKGDASLYQNRLQVKANGKSLIVKILPESTSPETITHSNSSSERADGKSGITGKVAETSKPISQELSNDEKALVDKVMKGNEKISGTPAKTVETASGGRLTTSRNPTSSFRFLGIVLFVFGLLGGFLFFLKRLKEAGGGQSKGIKKFLGKLGATRGGQKKVLQVIATLPLGPKKSITVVQIQNRMLVLGMSNDAVNLITEFKADEDDFDLAETMNLKDFADGLKGLETGESMNEKVVAQDRNPKVATAAASAFLSRASYDDGPKPPASRVSTQVSAYKTAADKRAVEVNPKIAGPAFSEVLKEESTKNSVRAQVRSRLEGMKQL
jgi:flagellar biogenesis protein FliO